MVLNSDAAHILQHDHQSSSHRPLSRYSLQARGELIILTSMDPHHHSKITLLFQINPKITVPVDSTIIASGLL